MAFQKKITNNNTTPKYILKKQKSPNTFVHYIVGKHSENQKKNKAPNRTM